MTRWLAAFALTQVIETPVYLRAASLGSVWRRLGIAFGASALTHPVVWFSFPHFGANWLLYLVCVEAFAVVAEALWLRSFGVAQPLWWSILANALSLGTGLAVRAIFGWP